MRKKLLLIVASALCVSSALASDGERKVTADQESKKKAATELAQQERKVSYAQQKISALIARETQVPAVVAAACTQLPAGVQKLIVDYQKPMFQKHQEFAQIVLAIGPEAHLGTLHAFIAADTSGFIDTGKRENLRLCVTQDRYFYTRHSIGQFDMPYNGRVYVPFKEPIFVGSADTKQMLCVYRSQHGSLECGELSNVGVLHNSRAFGFSRFKGSKIACLPTKRERLVVGVQEGDERNPQSVDQLLVLNVLGGGLKHRLNIPHVRTTTMDDVVICGNDYRQYVACYLSANKPVPDQDGVVHDTVAIYDLTQERDTPTTTLNVPRVHGNKKIASALVSNRQPVVIVPHGSTLNVIDLSSGKQTTALRASSTQPIVDCVAQNVGHRTMVAALRTYNKDAGSTIDVWDLETGETVAQHHTKDVCLDLALSEDGHLATHARVQDEKGVHWDIVSWKLAERADDGKKQ